MSWHYEGVACYVLADAQPGHAPLYRSWNGSDHFYTMSKQEYDSLPRQYNREGIACYIAPVPAAAHVPLFRLYNHAADDHFYTTSEREKNAAAVQGWSYEGIAGFVMPTAGSGHVPLYRGFNPDIGDHFYTRDIKEITDSGREHCTTGFVPTQHGFKFVNNFSVSLDFGIGAVGLAFGLCGGMSLSALKRYHNHQPIPPDTAPPAQGTPLYNELLMCQIESLLPDTWTRFISMQSRPDTPGMLSRHTIGFCTKTEWPALRRRLQSGAPTVLGLIRVDGLTADPSKNHQVLATGYIYNLDNDDLVIAVYDPNHPNNNNVTLKMNFGRPQNAIDASQSTGEPLRGFFVIDKD